MAFWIGVVVVIAQDRSGVLHCDAATSARAYFDCVEAPRKHFALVLGGGHAAAFAQPDALLEFLLRQVFAGARLNSRRPPSTFRGCGSRMPGPLVLTLTPARCCHRDHPAVPADADGLPRFVSTQFRTLQAYPALPQVLNGPSGSSAATA